MAPDAVARSVQRKPPKATTTLLMFLLLQSSAPALGQADAKAAAGQHFAKGVAAFDDRRFGEAIDEFETAYRLSPAFVVLYNIGQVDVILGRSVEAVDAFDKYLKQGASSISTTRRQAVQQEIEKQSARIRTIAVRTSPDGAEVRIDGNLVGKTRLSKPIRVNAGHHSVEAILSGYVTQARELMVDGRAETEIDLTLEAVASNTASAATPPVPKAPGAAIVTPTVTASTAALEARHALADVSSAAPSSDQNRRVEKTIIERTFVQTQASQTPSRSPQIESGTTGTAQRVIGYVVIAGGLATATVGGINAFLGANQANDANARLAEATTGAEYDAALPDYNAGKSRQQRGWIEAGIGAAVLVGGVVVLTTVPQRTSVVGLGPWMTAEAGGVVIEGAW